MMEGEKHKAIQEAANLGAAYFSALIEERMTRDDAISMANSFVIMFLSTKGIIKMEPPEPREPWKE